MLFVGSDTVAAAKVQKEGQRIDVHGPANENGQQSNKDETGFPMMLTEGESRNSNVGENDVLREKVQKFKELKRAERESLKYE